jgi:hypothetical protein
MAFAVAPSPRASADYLYDLTEDGLLVIIDQDLGNRSVTNDIENVLADLAQAEELATLAGRRVTYRDSDGDWCRVVLTKEGRFDRFCGFGLRVKDEAQAVELLRQVPK